MSKLLWELEREGSEMLFWEEVALCQQQIGFLPSLPVLSREKQNLKIVGQILQPVTVTPELLLKNPQSSHFSLVKNEIRSFFPVSKKNL